MMRMIEDPQDAVHALAGLTCWWCRLLLGAVVIAAVVMIAATSHDEHVLWGGVALGAFALGGLALYRLPSRAGR
jgi:hypothetical protein